MPQDATCPKCSHPFPVTEARDAFTVACPRCDAELTVEFKKPANPPEAGQSPHELIVAPGALSLAEIAPRRRQRRDDEPRSKRRSAGIVFVSGGLGLAFVVGGLSLTGWFLFTQIDTTVTASTTTPTVTFDANYSSRRAPSPPATNSVPNPVRARDRRPVEPVRPFPATPPGVRPPKQPKLPEPPREARLELPPLPEALPIKPAPVTKETSYKLPESVRAVRVGGGGRFLVLHFPTARKFGVFDASEAKIVRYIDAQEDDAVFAAGMTKLVVYLPGSGVVLRHDLLTGKREYSGKLDVPAGRVEAFCIGHASAGPLLVSVSNQGGMLFDIEDFKPMALPKTRQTVMYGGNATPRLAGGNYWAGATGRVFGHTGNYGMPNGVNTVVLGAGGVERYGQHVSTFFVVPGPDDRHVYSGGHGVLSEKVQTVPNAPYSVVSGSGFASHLYLPAHHGPYYLHAMTIGPIGGGKGEVAQGTVRLFVHGSKEPVAVIEDTAVSRYPWQGVREVRIEHSIHLIPKAKLLVIVPDGGNELKLYPVDIEAALAKSGRDYLFVTSSAPAHFERGKAFTYRPEVLARNGPVTFRVESGPPGMTVDGSGAVRWDVPADFAGAKVSVILLAKDAAGNEAFHTFVLSAAPAK